MQSCSKDLTVCGKISNCPDPLSLPPPAACTGMLLPIFISPTPTTFSDALLFLQAKFIERAQALLHGDLHTGSLMCTQDTTYMIDAEFAFYGPMAFDVQKMIANLLIAYCASFGLETADGPRDRQRAWMLQVQMCRPTSAGCWLAGSIMAGASASAASGGRQAGGDGLAWLGAMGRQAHAATGLHSARCACPLPIGPKHPLCNLLPYSQDGGVIVMHA